MQNFTLGKKGYSMLLFALILLIGSSPSFGQTCPTTEGTETTQTFCYLATVDELLILTDGDAVFQTNLKSDTQPIPETEILSSGVYYAGSSSGFCDGESGDTVDEGRIAITVTVNSAPRPVNRITNTRVSGLEFNSCASDNFNATDLELFFINDVGYELEVYSSEFDDAVYTGDLTPGVSYFVGQVPTGPEDAVNDYCPSLRTAVRFNPTSIEGPDAPSPQTFCEGATVADLMATGTYPNTTAIRWYRSDNPEAQPLPETTLLITGQTYYAGQVVNDSNKPTPPCETPAAERTPVIVEVITFDAGDDVTGDICEDDLRQRIANNEGANIIFSFVTDGRDPFPSEVSFNPSLGALAQQFSADPSQPIITTATFTTPEGCTDDVLFTITINESFNAGDDNTEGNVVCRAFFTEPTATEAEVEAYLRSLLNDAEGDEIDSDGNFSNDDITTITNLINGGSEGPFTTTYTVGAEEPCEDTADLAFEVDQADDLGTQTGDGIYCQSDIDERIASGPATNNFYQALARELFLEQLDSGVPQDGDFVNSTLAQVVTAYGNGIRAFSTTYSITTENGCTSSVDISFDIIESTNAGDSNLTNNTACRSEFSTTATEAEVQNYLVSLLSNDADTDGDFSNLTSIASSITSGDNGPFNSTYTTGAGTGCSDTSEFQFSVVEEMPANAGSFNDPTPVCENDNTINLFTDIENNDPDAMKTGTFSGMGVTNNVFDPSAVTPGETYTITYTVSADPENCITGSESSTTFDITVDPAPISANVTRELCVTQARELISNESEGYAFVLGILAESGVGSVNPANFAPGTTEEAEALASFIETPTSDSETFTFLYSTPSGNSCDDGEINIAITINNIEDANAGVIEDQEVCSNEGIIDLTTYLTDPNTTPGGSFSGDGVDENGMFDPSIGSKDGGYLITYNVDGTASCVTAGTSDSETFTITVFDSPNAGADLTPSFCTNEIENFIANPSEALNVFNDFITDQGADVDTNGTFNRTVGDFFTYYTSGDFTTPFLATYSVSNSNCTDTAEIAITITQTETVELEPISDFDVCASEDSLNLFTYLGLNGGSFSYGSDVIENGLIDVTTLGVFPEITYTVNEDVDTTDCIEGSDSTTFTVEVVAPVNAGSDKSRSLCVNEIAAIIAEGTARNYYLNLLDAGVARTGTFTPLIQTLVDRYNNSADKTGTYTSIYRVQNGNCVDEASITVVVIANNVVKVGPIANQETCVDGENITLGTLLNADNTTLGGTFSGTGVTNGIFNPATAGAGTFTITYNVNSNTNPCAASNASRSFTIKVTEEASQAEVGTIANQETCVDGEIITLATLLNPDTTTLSGTFSGTGVTNGFFDPATAGVGTFTITYDVNGEDNACVIGNASGSFTILVTEEGTQSEVGVIENQEACIDGNTIELATLLNPDDTTLGGTFTGTGVTNGIFDPATAGVGSFTITYDVNGDDLPCSIGNATGTFTVNVTDLPDAPVADANQTFCLIDSPTVGDIVVTGDNVVIYTDADLSEDNIADVTTGLISGNSYYAVSTNDADDACTSDAVMITVTVSETPAPTLSTDGDEFCRSDNPTIQDLINNFTGSGVLIYTSSTGGTSLAATTPLENGVTYYGASVDGTTGCESSERRDVQVEVTFCGIPEGFSPNGDGINDRFVIPDIATNYPSYSIEIFNRWGNVVFKGNASTPDWDGISNQSGTLGNDVLPVGVYFYILNYNDGQTPPVQGKLYLSI